MSALFLERWRDVDGIWLFYYSNFEIEEDRFENVSPDSFSLV